MLCSEVMKKDVRSVSRVASLTEAATLMRDANVGFLPICDPNGKIVGTVTDRDIVVRGVATECGPDTCVTSVMSDRDLIACKPDDDLQTAENRMTQAHVSRILVVDDDFRLQGVISLSDIAEHDQPRAVDTLRAVASREGRSS